MAIESKPFKQMNDCIFSEENVSSDEIKTRDIL